MSQVNENETLNIGQLKKYAGLYLARKKLKTAYDKLGKRLEKMAPSLIEHMQSHELSKLPLKGGRTLYIDIKIWSKYLPDKTAADVITAAREDGLFVSLGGKEVINAQTLASYLRELNDEEKPLPKNLAKVIEPNPVRNLIVKKH